MVSYSSLPEPPTASTIAAARQDLTSQRSTLASLTASIEHAENELAALLAESKRKLSSLREEHKVLENKLLRTMAYVSPMRRLPNELLREVFLIWFEEYPCAAWIIASVCGLWRRLALGMPKIWSKIRLLTTQHASADTIRLWLERSGSQVPLDIEIYLQVSKKSSGPSGASSSRAHPHTVSLSPWIPPPFLSGGGGGVPATYVVSHPSSHTMVVSTGNIAIPPPPPPPHFPPANTPFIVPPSGHGDGWGSSSRTSEKSPMTSRKSSHWGHIAIYYLMEQVHRWERFVFRFDKQFTSMNALKSINGDAPLLREFEISCGEPAFYGEMPWLPCAPPASTVSLSSLRSLTLQNAPFKWSSPMLRPNLTSLTLRALPTSHLALDRVLSIVAANPRLETLGLYFASILPAVLPLSPTSLVDLKELSIGGHYLLTLLADSLITPSLSTLNLDIETRDPIEDTITNLLARSNHPPLRHLSIFYLNSSTNASGGSFYYGPGGIVIGWAFLAELAWLRSLRVGGTALEPLLSALGMPDDDSGGGGGGWCCPRLERLEIKHCPAHADGIGKLVQMVDGRNPAGPGSAAAAASSLTGFGFSAGSSAGGGSVGRLKRLALYECAPVGVDVVAWLRTRIGDVVCQEPMFERSTLTGNPYL